MIHACSNFLSWLGAFSLAVTVKNMESCLCRNRLIITWIKSKQLEKCWLNHQKFIDFRSLGIQTCKVSLKHRSLDQLIKVNRSACVHTDTDTDTHTHTHTHISTYCISVSFFIDNNNSEEAPSQALYLAWMLTCTQIYTTGVTLFST